MYPVRWEFRVVDSFVQGNPQHNDTRFVDSRCSRHMTGNIAYLSDFKQFDGGYVVILEECARTPQANGVAERRNRTLIEAARTMLADSKLPTTFWAEAVSTACYVQNRVLVVKPHNKTPYELFRDSAECYNGEPKTADDAKKQVEDGLNNENAKQERFADDSSSKDVNAVGQQVNTASPDVNTGSLKLNVVGPSVSTASPNEEDNTEEESEVDLGNITNSYIVPNTLNTRIHKDHPIDNVIGEVQSTVQTRRMLKPTSEQGLNQQALLKLYLIHPGWKQCRKELSIQTSTSFDNGGSPKMKEGYLNKMVFKNKKYGEGELRVSNKQELLQLLLIWKKPLVKDEDVDDVDVHLYRSNDWVLLMYLTASRPDIMFAVCACARFQVTPKTSHLLAVKRIFRYLKSKPTLGLWYSRDSPFELVAYTDSDYAGATLDRKSTTGGCQFLGNRLISWQCKKQTVVATSTTKAEYVAAASCYRQVHWIQNQLLDYGYNFMNTVINIDNNNLLAKVNAVRLKLVLPVFVSAVKRMLMLPVQVSAVEVNPIIYTSCIEQFWATAKVQTVNGVQQLQALVDKKRVIVTESSIRRDLHLNDAGGTDCLPTTTIFEELAHMGAKSTAWNEFSSSMASLIICLATNQKFNLYKYIFDAMVKHLDGGVKFLLYLRFLQVFINQQLGNMSTYKKIFVNPFHTKKVFANMKRAGKDFSRRITPLFDTMMVQPVEEMGHDLQKVKDAQANEIATLKKRIQRLERRKMSRPTDASKQGRSIKDIDADVDVSLVDETQERQYDDLIFDFGVLEDDVMHVEANFDGKDEHSKKLDNSTAGEAVTTANSDDSVVPTTNANINDSVEPSEFKVPQEIQPSSSKDKGKGIMIKPEVPLKRKDKIALDEQIERDIQAKLDAELLEEQKLARKQEEKEDAWKEKSRERTAKESSKKQKVEEEKESEEVDEVELKKLLVIKKDEDIAIKAIPLATKLPVIIDYKLHKEGKDREELEALWRIVMAKYGDTRPENEFERVLYGDLKVMFEPNIKSDIWRMLQGYRVTIWKLIDSFGFHFVRLLALVEVKTVHIEDQNISPSSNVISIKEQTRRIFLDGYGVLAVRYRFFIFLRLSSKLRAFERNLHQVLYQMVLPT
ncbi:uncharacterized mitochondrial protein-like protein [Tanacetum coccineum]